jgi:DNA-binding transcriptional MerR regulator
VAAAGGSAVASGRLSFLAVRLRAPEVVDSKHCQDYSERMLAQLPAASADITLDELVTALEAMCAGLPAVGDGRVSAAPDARTIRYYQSLGLVDRPLYRARQARYGRRHAAQAAAVKRLQVAGYKLDQIQLALSGATDAELEALLAEAGAASAPVFTGPAAVVAEPAPSPWGRSWSAQEIAPGVVVLVDPARVPDVASTLVTLARALGVA